MNYSNEPRALYALCRCLPWWCVCVYVCVCVQILYSTLVDLNDIALRLFMMGVELNGKKNKIKNRMRNEGVWWRCDRGEEIPVDFVFFYFFRPSEKETAGWNLIWKHFLACLPSIFIPAPPRSTSSRPLSTFPSRRSLFMLWTANRWAELFRGLNYVVILGFFCLLCPSFFCPRERRHFILVGDRAVLFSARCRRGRKGKEKEARRGRKVRLKQNTEWRHKKLRTLTRWRRRRSASSHPDLYLSFVPAQLAASRFTSLSPRLSPLLIFLFLSQHVDKHLFFCFLLRHCIFPPWICSLCKLIQQSPSLLTLPPETQHLLFSPLLPTRSLQPCLINYIYALQLLIITAMAPTGSSWTHLIIIHQMIIHLNKPPLIAAPSSMQINNPMSRTRAGPIEIFYL